MTREQEILLKEIKQEIKRRYPAAQIGSHWEDNEGAIGLYVYLPDGEDPFDFAQEIAPWAVETLEKTGVLIYVVPLPRG